MRDLTLTILQVSCLKRLSKVLCRSLSQGERRQPRGARVGKADRRGSADLAIQNQQGRGEHETGQARRHLGGEDGAGPALGQQPRGGRQRDR